MNDGRRHGNEENDGQDSRPKPLTILGQLLEGQLSVVHAAHADWTKMPREESYTKEAKGQGSDPAPAFSAT